MRAAGVMLTAMLLLVTARSAVSDPRSFAVILHKSNPAHDLRLTEVRSFFSGSTRRWPDHKRVVLVERDTGSGASHYLIESLLGTSVAEYRRRIANIEFMGEEPVILKTLNSDAAACKFVFNVPDAIGFVEAGSLDQPECRSIKIARIEGRLPGEEGYRLR